MTQKSRKVAPLDEKKTLVIRPLLFDSVPIDGRVFLEAVGRTWVTEYRICGVDIPKSTVVRIGDEHIPTSVAQEEPSVPPALVVMFFSCGGALGLFWRQR